MQHDGQRGGSRRRPRHRTSMRSAGVGGRGRPERFGLTHDDSGLASDLPRQGPAPGRGPLVPRRRRDQVIRVALDALWGTEVWVAVGIWDARQVAHDCRQLSCNLPCARNAFQSLAATASQITTSSSRVQSCVAMRLRRCEATAPSGRHALAPRHRAAARTVPERVYLDLGFSARLACLRCFSIRRISSARFPSGSGVGPTAR